MRFLLAVFLLASCGVQETFIDGELVSRSIFLGAAKSDASCADGLFRQKTDVLGLQYGTNAGSVGLSSNDFVCMPSGECSAVFFVSSQAAIEEILEAHGDLEGLCFQ